MCVPMTKTSTPLQWVPMTPWLLQVLSHHITSVCIVHHLFESCHSHLHLTSSAAHTWYPMIFFMRCTASPQRHWNTHTTHQIDLSHSSILYFRIYGPGSQDKTIRLWRTSDLAPIASLSGHKRGIWKVAFSPVDRCLASCSGDRTVRLWSVVDYTCLRVFEGHTASVLTVKFANKGMQLLSGAADGLIRLWTIRSGECENTFDLHSDRVWAIAVGNNTAPGTHTTLLPSIVTFNSVYCCWQHT